MANANYEKIITNLGEINGDEGLILDQNIYINESLICPKGTELTKEKLILLKKHIENRNDLPLNKKQISVLRQMDYNKKILLDHNTVEETLDKNTQFSMEQLLKELIETEKINQEHVAKIISTAQRITTNMLNSKDFSYNLASYKENKPYNDVINIVAFSVELAKMYEPKKLNSKEIEQIATAALLCNFGKKYENKDNDIQKLEFNSYLREQIKQNEKYDIKDGYKEEYQTTYTHATFSPYNEIISNAVLKMILDSDKTIEENIGKKEDVSYIGSKIIHLARVYNDILKDALTYNKISVNNIKNELKEAVRKKIITNEEQQLLINTIPLYSKNERVKLSDGNYGIIENSGKSNSNPELCDEPIIRVLSSEEEYLVDIKNDYTVRIVDVVSNNDKLTDNMKREVSNNIIAFPNVEETENVKSR